MIRRLYPVRWLVPLALICTLSLGMSPAPRHAVLQLVQLVQTPQSKKTSSPQIGSAMAVLATLLDAEVLPPEGTPEANHIIKWVIQFQSVFMKSEDASVHAFARQALTPTYGEQTAGMLASLHLTGWTAEMLEALADEEARTTEDARQTLIPGFGQFNLSVEDFHRFMQLVREARQSFTQRGLEFRTVFASRRKEMPGAGSS